MDFRGEILLERFVVVVVSVFMEFKGDPVFREGPSLLAVRELRRRRRVRHRPRVMSRDAAGMWSIRAVLSLGRERKRRKEGRKVVLTD